MKVRPQDIIIKKKDQKKVKNIEKFTIAVCLFISTISILEWFFDYENMSKMIQETDAFRFSSALTFLFAGLNLMIFKKKNKIAKYSYLFFTLLIIFIGTTSLLEYFGIINFKIINLLILTEHIQTSPIIAFCTIIIGVVFLGLKSDNKFVAVFCKFLLSLVLTIAMIAILSFILIIPLKNDYLGFGTLGIQSSILFFSVSLVLLLKNKSSMLYHILNRKLRGSQIFRKILPLIILLPIVLANIILLAIKQNWMSIEFGIITYTIIFIPLSILYISRLAFEFNKTDLERLKNENNLINKNYNLTKFNQALNLIATVVITDENGIIKYVNKSFCNTSQYSRKEVIGKTHKIINSGYHSNEFFKNMWSVIKEGKVWIGEIKNKAKDGSYYWVSTTITPTKDDHGKITGYLSVRQNIPEPKEST